MLRLYIGGEVGNTREIGPPAEKAAASTRPFGQRDYVALFGNVLRPNMTGEHYQYTILLPIREYFDGEKDKAKGVFNSGDVKLLRELLREDFGGLTFSFTTGDWKLESNGRNVINDHAQYKISCQKNVTVMKYFEELKANLLLYAFEVRDMPQEDIYVQKSEIDLGENVIDKPPLEELKDRLTKLKERLKNMKR